VKEGVLKVAQCVSIIGTVRLSGQTSLGNRFGATPGGGACLYGRGEKGGSVEYLPFGGLERESRLPGGGDRTRTGMCRECGRRA